MNRAWVTAISASTDVAVEEIDDLVRIVRVGEGTRLATSVGSPTRTALSRSVAAYGVLRSDDSVSIIVTDRAGFADSRLPAIFLPGAEGEDEDDKLHTVLHEMLTCGGT